MPIFHPSVASRHIFGQAAEVLTVFFDDDNKAIEAATELISWDERKRSRHFVFERDRRKYVFWRACLRRFLAERIEVPAQLIDFTYGQYGKPVLAPLFAKARLHFNLSHSGDLAIIIFSRVGEVGADLESIRVLEGVDDIAAHMCSRSEYTAFRALEPADRTLSFFTCWTLKEAFVKAIGNGLTYPLHRIAVSFSPNEAPRILQIDGATVDQIDWEMESFCPASGFVASCVLNRTQ